MEAGVPQFDLVDLFCGCGGASAGFLGSGAFRHLYAADIDQWAVSTYSRNLGHAAAQVDLRRLAEDTSAEWAADIRSQAVNDLALFGGPPCQGFSSHVKMKGDRHGRNTLVGTFGELATALEPRLIVMENVPDLVSERWWPVFEGLRATLADAGYNVRARIINFAQFGIPQERFRLVLLASRDFVPTFPSPKFEPSEFSTVKEWIGQLPPIASGEADPLDPMHEASKHRESTLEIIRNVPADGGSRPPDVGPDCLRRARDSFGGYTDVYGRLAWSETAPTITARCRTPSCGRFVHPEQHRGLTAREAGLLQTFPDTWHFEGPFDDRFKQIGNAVPPLAMQTIAVHLAAGSPTVDREVGLFEAEGRPVGTSFSVLIPGIRRRGGVL